MKRAAEPQGIAEAQLVVADARQTALGLLGLLLAFGLALGLEVQDHARERADALVFCAHVMFLRARSAGRWAP